MRLVMSKARSASVAIQLLPARLVPVTIHLDVTTAVLIKRCENSPQPSCCMKSVRSAPRSLAVGMKHSTKYPQAAISLNIAMHRAPFTLLHLPPRIAAWSRRGSCWRALRSFLFHACKSQISILYTLFILNATRSVLNSVYL